MDQITVILATLKRPVMTCKLEKTEINNLDLVSGKIGKIYTKKTSEQKKITQAKVSNALNTNCNIVTLYVYDKEILSKSSKDRISSIIEDNQQGIYSNSLYFDNLNYLNELTDLELHYFCLTYQDFCFATDDILDRKVLSDTLRKRFDLVDLSSYKNYMKRSDDNKDDKNVKKSKKNQKKIKKNRESSDDESNLEKFNYHKGNRNIFFIQMLFSEGDIGVNSSIITDINKNEYLLKTVSHIDRMRNLFSNDIMKFLMTYNYPIIGCNSINTLMRIPDLYNDMIYETKDEFEQEQIVLNDAGIKLFKYIMNDIFQNAINNSKRISYPTRFVFYVKLWVRISGEKAYKILKEYVMKVFPTPAIEPSNDKLVMYAMADIRYDQLDSKMKSAVRTSEISKFISERMIRPARIANKLDEEISRLTKNMMDDLFEEGISYDDIKDLMYEEYVKNRPENEPSIQQTFGDLHTTDEESVSSKIDNDVNVEEEDLKVETIEQVNSAELLMNDTPCVSDAEEDTDEDDMNLELQKAEQSCIDVVNKMKKDRLLRQKQSDDESSESLVLDLPAPDTIGDSINSQLNDFDQALANMLVKDETDSMITHASNTKVNVEKLEEESDDLDADDEFEMDDPLTGLSSIDDLLHITKKETEVQQDVICEELKLEDESSKQTDSSISDALFKRSTLPRSNGNGSCFWSSLYILKNGRKDDIGCELMKKEIFDMMLNDDEFYYQVQIMAQSNVLAYDYKDPEQAESLKKTLLMNEWSDQNMFPIASVYLSRNVCIIDLSSRTIRSDITCTYPEKVYMINEYGAHYDPLNNVEECNLPFVSYSGGMYECVPEMSQLIPKPARNNSKDQGVDIPHHDLEIEPETQTVIAEINGFEHDHVPKEKKPKTDWSITTLDIEYVDHGNDVCKIQVPHFTSETDGAITLDDIAKLKDCSMNTVNTVNALLRQLAEMNEYNAKKDQIIDELKKNINEGNIKMEEAIKEFKQEIASIKHNFEDKLIQKDTLIDDMRKNETIIMDKLDKSQQMTNELAKQNKEYKTLIDNMKQKEDAMKNDFDESLNTINELKRKDIETSSKLEQLSKENETIVLEKKQLEKNVNVLHQQNEDYIAMIESINNTLHEKTNELNTLKREGCSGWEVPDSSERYIPSSDEEKYKKDVLNAVLNFTSGTVTYSNYDKLLEDVHHISHGVEQAHKDNKPISVYYGDHIVHPFIETKGNYIILKKKCPCNVSKTISEWVQNHYVTIGDGVLQNERVCGCMVKPANLVETITWAAFRPHMREMISELTARFQ